MHIYSKIQKGFEGISSLKVECVEDISIPQVKLVNSTPEFYSTQFVSLPIMAFFLFIPVALVLNKHKREGGEHLLLGTYYFPSFLCLLLEDM